MRQALRSGRASRTAEAVCFLRGLAGVDPYAGELLGPIARVALARPMALPLLNLASGTLLASIAARTRFIDEVVEAGLAGGAVRLVLLGAGLDARPWRFAPRLGDRPVYLVDHPASAENRARRSRTLPTRPQDVRIDVDFARDDLRARLRSAGLTPGSPSVFVWEGVSMYLPEAAVRQTLADIAALAGPGSLLAFDLWSDEGAFGRASHAVGALGLGLLGEPLRSTCHADAVGPLLADAGFALDTLSDTATWARKAAVGVGHPRLLLARASRS
ncbi:MAG: SAM-dependent methyltransferase [bacterium]